MFLGATPLSLDAKGRLTVPSKHRDALFADGAKTVVLTASTRKCLVLYTMAHWRLIEAQLAPLSALNPTVALVKLMVLGRAEILELDGSGRLQTSPFLRAHAHFDKDVVMAGVGSNLEIWDEAAWSEQEQALLEVDMSALPKELEGIPL